jgi:hypothetical protein
MFLINFRAYMNILFIVKTEILFLIKSSYRSPKLCWWLLNEPKMVYNKMNMYSNVLKTHDDAFLVSVIRFTPNHIPLKLRRLFKMSIWTRHVYLQLALELKSPNNTQPKGVESNAEIETWQCVRPSRVGSMHACCWTPTVTPCNDTVARQAVTLGCPPKASHHITFHHGIPMPWGPC